MEPTEAAYRAGLAASNGVNPIDAAAIVRAAFAAVPDPLELADKWEDNVREDPDDVRPATAFVSELRAFMRGDNK